MALQNKYCCYKTNNMYTTALKQFMSQLNFLLLNGVTCIYTYISIS